MEVTWKLQFVELPWNHQEVLADGICEALPAWRHGNAPTGLVTRKQLREQGLRRGTGQDYVGWVEYRRGRVTPLYLIDEAVLPRTKTPALLASVAAMGKAHRTCCRCGSEHDRYLPPSTWMCGDCMEATGDYGGPYRIKKPRESEHAA